MTAKSTSLSWHLLLLLVLSTAFSSGIIYAKNQTRVHINKYCTRGSDISAKLQELVDQYQIVIIDKGAWIVSKPIYLRSDVVIKGASKNKSILYIDPNAIIGAKGKFCLFTTADPISLYGKDFRSFPINTYKEKKYKNITISDLTIEVNRQPAFFRQRNANPRTADLNVVRFENCKNCTLSNCILRDCCNEESFNNTAIVKIVESDSCLVEKCTSYNCTFLQILSGVGSVANLNTGYRSVGTWIETCGGFGHIISNNKINNILTNVSTIGVNSPKCHIIGNIIANDNGQEISCLTLGHSQEKLDVSEMGTLCYRADSTVVRDNNFTTTGSIAILIQNGSNLELSSNKISSRPERNDFAPGTVYIHGQNDNLHNIRIINNSIDSYGRKGSAICGDCLNDVLIEGNKIHTTCRYAIRITKKTTNSNIVGNTINAPNSEIINTENINSLSIVNNKFIGGRVIAYCRKMRFENNQWSDINMESQIHIVGNDFISKSNEIVINNNTLSTTDKVSLIKLFNVVSQNNIKIDVKTYKNAYNERINSIY